MEGVWNKGEVKYLVNIGHWGPVPLLPWNSIRQPCCEDLALYIPATFADNGCSSMLGDHVPVWGVTSYKLLRRGLIAATSSDI